MSSPLTRHLPNTITCLNLASGCVAIALAFAGQYAAASIAICCAALFDFLDGAVARLTHSYSDMGKELDSLSDLVSFGVAPAAMVYCQLPHPMSLFAIAIPICGGLRLARFNVDTRQTDSFIGLPIPANALFWIGVSSFWTTHLPQSDPWLWATVVVFVALSMLAPIHLPSLKFHNLKFNGENRLRYLIIFLTIGFTALLGVAGLSVAVAVYLLIGALGTLRRK